MTWPMALVISAFMLSFSWVIVGALVAGAIHAMHEDDKK